MLKRGIGIGLLCVAGHAYSDSINVTTTVDEIKNDDLCSLREAIEYIKLSQANTSNEKAIDPYNGCSGITSVKTSAPVVYLESEATYELNSEIKLEHSVHIQAAAPTGSSSNITNNERALKPAILKAKLNNRLFNVARPVVAGSETDRINVYLSYLTLQGDPATTGIQQGGLIFNRENLGVNYSTLKDGRAQQGGAIYNAGTMANNSYKNAGTVAVIGSLIQNNKANQGAILFTEQALYEISGIVAKENEATASQGYLIYTELSFDEDTLGQTGFQRNAWLYNSTILKNKAYIINVRDGVAVNNVTIIGNDKGIYFQAPKGLAQMSNTILTQNGNLDCSFSADDKSILQKNLVTSLTQCGMGTNTNPNNELGTEKLIAGTSLEGKCDAAPNDGILCPYRVPENNFLGYFKPRLLMKYNLISDSLIVNRGRINSDGTSSNSFACEPTDQRGNKRPSTELCDLGAIEIGLDTEQGNLLGKEVKFGETALLNLDDVLKDSELVPAEACKSIMGADLDPQGQPWKKGCLREKRTDFFQKVKGSINFADDNQIRYQPVSNWHGTDEVELLFVTTVTRFSESVNERDFSVLMRIVQNPENNFENKTVNVSGGAFGWFSLLVLGFVGLRRHMQGGKSK